jgi:ribonuclease-3 family protein
MSLYQLSFLGDAVFELMVREYAIEQNIVKLKDLQEFTLDFVTAKNQAYFANMIGSTNILTEQEKDILRKGRNIKTHKSPKNCDAITYKWATGFECLIGYLYITDKNKLKEVFNYIKSA